MTEVPEHLATAEDEIVDATKEFFRNCGGNPEFQISVLDTETKEVEFLPITKPYAVMGRGKDCDIILRNREISYRHAYLQLLRHRLLVVDLGSRVGTQWNEKRRRSGWLLPGREIHVANYAIKLVKWKQEPGSSVIEDDSLIDVKSLLELDSQPFPHASLELLSLNSKNRTGRNLRLKPGVTLIGRSRVAQVRLKHDSVSHIHSSLVLTPDGLWIVDLQGRGGTLVNGAPIEFARLRTNDELKVGAFHLRVETSLMKPLTGVAKSQLESPQQLAETSDPAGDSSVLQQMNSHAEGDPSEFEEDLTPSEEESTVMGEVDGDSARWAEIIDALKAGGFGT